MWIGCLQLGYHQISGSSIQLYYLPTYFQVVRGASAIHSGVLLLPLISVQTVCAFASGIITSKTGEYYWILVVGYLLWRIGLAFMGSTNENSSTAMLAVCQVVMGIGADQPSKQA